MINIDEMDDYLYDDDYGNGYYDAVNRVIDVINDAAGVEDGRE